MNSLQKFCFLLKTIFGCILPLQLIINKQTNKNTFCPVTYNPQTKNTVSSYHNQFNAELYPQSKLGMFCELSQNYQQFLSKMM